LILGTVTPADTDSIRGVATGRSAFSKIIKERTVQNIILWGITPSAPHCLEEGGRTSLRNADTCPPNYTALRVIKHVQ